MQLSHGPHHFDWPGYPSAMKTGQQAFIEMRSSFTTL